MSKSTLQYMIRRRRTAPDYHEIRALVEKLGQTWDAEWEHLWRCAAAADSNNSRQPTTAANTVAAHSRAATRTQSTRDSANTAVTGSSLEPERFPIPRETPCPVSDFSGRAAELEKLRALLLPAAPVSTELVVVSSSVAVVGVITGMGGVGKSELAVQAAHQMADAFPDGQLYIDLQGASPDSVPLPPLEAIGRLLRSLGLNPRQVPTTAAEASARLRSMTADRRLLMLLDNARDVAQVRPLLPGNTTCRVLVTGRQLLPLEGAYQLRLDPLPAPDAIALVDRLVGGHRTASDPQAAAEVVELCGLLPLAIRIAGARLAARPARPIHILVQRLTDAASRLRELETGQVAVSASFDVSMEALHNSDDPVDHTAQRAFDLAGLLDGPDFGCSVAACLLGEPEPAAEAALERLVDANLISSEAPGRYRFHDLLRLHARHRARSRYSTADRADAVTRAFAFYTATARRTCALLRPGDHRATARDNADTEPALSFPDTSSANAWLELERPNLIASIEQAAAHTARSVSALASELAQALFGFFDVRGYVHDGIRANHTALTVARRVGNRPDQAQALHDLGGLYWRSGNYDLAARYLTEALSAYRELGDIKGQAYSLGNLGITYQKMGEYHDAIAAHHQSLHIRRSLGNLRDQAVGLVNLGVLYVLIGQHAEAIEHFVESLPIFEEMGDRRGQAFCLGNLGVAHEQLEKYETAMTYLEESLSILTELGDQRGEADNLNNLARIYQQTGQRAKAIGYHKASITIFGKLDDIRGRIEVLRDLGDTLSAAGHPQHARRAWIKALQGNPPQIPEIDDIRSRLAQI